MNTQTDLITPSPREVEELMDQAGRERKIRKENALQALLGLRYNVVCLAWSDRKADVLRTIQKWILYFATIEGDIAQNDLGSVYREVASHYNHLADNERDESHTTTIDR